MTEEFFNMVPVPMPEETAADIIIDDKFKAAFKFSFLGIGRGGSRIVETFNQLGYNRTCVVNTAKQDLDEINLPDEKKLWLGVGGAGSNRRQGLQYVQEHSEDILDLMRKSYGTSFDRIMLCVAAGGGTGSGGFEAALKIANDLTEELRIKKVGDETKVGAIIALPMNSERSYMRNALELMKFIEICIKNKSLSPIILVDNERIMKLYPSATIGNVWSKANLGIATLFHLFNIISVASTKHIALDPADLDGIMKSGLVTFGATPLRSTTKEDIGKAIRDNLNKNVLCSGVVLDTCKIAGCIITGPKEQLESITAQNIDHGFEVLERLVSSKTVHRGIYTTAANSPLSAYTIIGGLELPKDRLLEIARMSGNRDWDE